MTRAITFTLILDEAGLFTAPGGDPNTESSLSYIPGGAIRGALVAAYLRDHPGASQQLLDDLFLSGRIRYLNAYPRLTARTYPTPRAWATQKDGAPAEDDDYAKDQSANRVTTVYDRVDDDQRAAAEDGLPQGVKDMFVTFAAIEAPPPATNSVRQATPPRVDFEIAVHTARNREYGRSRENDRDSALFRYRALARDQEFVGVVVADDPPPAGYDWLLKLLQGSRLLMGGSHKAGYGLTQVADGQEAIEAGGWREADGARPGDIAAGEKFVLRLASDAILYEPGTGRPTTDVRHFLPGMLDDYVIEHSYAAAGWVGGFNKQWGLPLAQQWAARMGSVWVVTAKNGLSAAGMAELERTGIGVRTAEGFGRVVFDPPSPTWPVELKEKQAISAFAPESTAGHALLDQMNERIVRAEIDRRLAVQVNELAVRGRIRGHLSRSQLGRLQVRIRREAGKDNFNGFLDYLEGTRKRKSADDQFRKFTVDGRNFRDLLEQLAGKPPAE